MITPNTTMGLEVEIQYLNRLATQGMERWLNFTVANDGSIRSRTYHVGDLAVYPQFHDEANEAAIVCAGMSESDRFGLELVTAPYTYMELNDGLSEKLADWLGLVPQSSRSSIHVHVDVADTPWVYVRNCVLWARALEAIIYRLASAGMVHRGERRFNGEPNDHRYARPLSDPIGINWGPGPRSLGPLIKWNELVEASTASEFVASWGRLDWYWSGMASLPHYCPHRLHMVNIASILRQGTFEWRVFDALYMHIPLIVNLVYRIHELAASGPPTIQPMPLGTRPDVSADWVCHLLDLDITPLWGERWSTGCTERNRRSHYTDSPTLSHTSHDGVHTISVHRIRDNGSETFPLFSRLES